MRSGNGSTPSTAAGRADQIGDMLGQQAGAAADVEHALAGHDGELPYQKLAGLELTVALTRS